MKAELTADTDLELLFATEDTRIMNGRARYTVHENVFSVEAEDPTAMRAVLNSIVKAIKIYEDMGDISAA